MIIFYPGNALIPLFQYACIVQSALCCLCLTLFVSIIINMVILLIALSETTAITKITALITVAFIVCHYINYHNGSDRLLLSIHISEQFVILNSRGELEATSILIRPCLHVPPSFSKFKKAKRKMIKTITKPSLLMELKKLLALS